MSKKFVIGLCQILVGSDKAVNLTVAKAAIANAVKQGAQIVALPECFNSPYNVGKFREYSEIIPKDETKCTEKDNPTTSFLLNEAKTHGIYLVGGSFPEIDDNKIYNTSIVINPSGKIIAKHRKLHLFDIDVPGGIKFKESETLTGGSTCTTFETEWCKFGLGICYDIRFPEYAQLLRSKGCEVLIYPGAFNMTTGPPHFSLLQRARALDCQCYVATVSPSRSPDPKAAYHAYGHSAVNDPWGSVMKSLEFDSGVIVQEIDLTRVKEIRQSIPTSFQKRTDVYTLVKENK